MARRDEREVLVVERDSSSPIWWLLVGGAVGAGLALLFAPHPGEKTRRLVARRLWRLRESAEEMFDELAEAESSEADGSDPTDDVELEPAEDELTDAADEDEDEDDEEPAAAPGRDARAELEKRLAAARARRQRALDEDEEPVA